VELTVDGGSSRHVQAGRAPMVDGTPRADAGRLRLGHHRHVRHQWQGLVDEVVVVDDHITGVVSEHQAGKVIGWQPTGIRINGRLHARALFPRLGAGQGWGGTKLTDPLEILEAVEPEEGRAAGAALLMVSTTGEEYAYYVLDDDLRPAARSPAGGAAPSSN
jgi:6-hydroxynicotinate reductase